MDVLCVLLEEKVLMPVGLIAQLNFTSNTFYNISCDQEAFNSNVWNRQKNTVNLSKNIFYDSCKGEFNRRIVGGRTDSQNM